MHYEKGGCHPFPAPSPPGKRSAVASRLNWVDTRSLSRPATIPGVSEPNPLDYETPEPGIHKRINKGVVILIVLLSILLFVLFFTV